MTQLRKILGVFILMFMAIPILFAVIWAVGLTKGVVSQEFITTVPEETIRLIPEFTKESLQGIKEIESDLTADEKIWFQAIEIHQDQLINLPEKTGLLPWLRTEFNEFLTAVNDVLRGERLPEDVKLDLKPLKNILKHAEFSDFISNVANELPVCSESAPITWEFSKNQFDFSGNPPACRPSESQLTAFLADLHHHIDTEIPDQLEVFKNGKKLPGGIDFSQMIVSLTYILFFLPLLLIVGGAWLSANDRIQFFRWSGVSIFIGGGLAWLLAAFITRGTSWMAYTILFNNPSQSTYLNELFLDKVGEVVLTAARILIDQVSSVAEVVCIIGIIVFALSFVFPKPVINPPVRPVPTQNN
jgi:hypothetical protein